MIKEEIDPEYVRPNEPTRFETELNRFELSCGTCGEKFFVDSETLDKFEKAIAFDPDNQFICPECTEFDGRELEASAST